MARQIDVCFVSSVEVDHQKNAEKRRIPGRMSLQNIIQTVVIATASNRERFGMNEKQVQDRF